MQPAPARFATRNPRPEIRDPRPATREPARRCLHTQPSAARFGLHSSRATSTKLHAFSICNNQMRASTRLGPSGKKRADGSWSMSRSAACARLGRDSRLRRVAASRLASQRARLAALGAQEVERVAQARFARPTGSSWLQAGNGNEANRKRTGAQHAIGAAKRSALVRRLAPANSAIANPIAIVPFCVMLRTDEGERHRKSRQSASLALWLVGSLLGPAKAQKLAAILGLCPLGRARAAMPDAKSMPRPWAQNSNEPEWRAAIRVLSGRARRNQTKLRLGRLDANLIGDSSGDSSGWPALQLGALLTEPRARRTSPSLRTSCLGRPARCTSVRASMQIHEWSEFGRPCRLQQRSVRLRSPRELSQASEAAARSTSSKPTTRTPMRTQIRVSREQREQRERREQRNPSAVGNSRAASSARRRAEAEAEAERPSSARLDAARSGASGVGRPEKNAPEPGGERAIGPSDAPNQSPTNWQTNSARLSIGARQWAQVAGSDDFRLARLCRLLWALNLATRAR